MPARIASRIAPWLALLFLLVAAALLGGLFALTTLDGDPVASSRILEVDPADRVIDRDRRNTFTVHREVCGREVAQVRVLREWAEFVQDPRIRPTVAWSLTHFYLREGCQEVRALQPVPMTLPPGQYVFQVTLLAPCRLGKCPEHKLEPITLTLTNGVGWPKIDIPPPPTAEGVQQPAMQSAPTVFLPKGP